MFITRIAHNAEACSSQKLVSSTLLENTTMAEKSFENENKVYVMTELDLTQKRPRSRKSP